MKSSKSKYTVNQLVIISLLTALAYAVMFVGRVPMVAFLKYDPKDIVIMLSGMAFGPAITILMSTITSVIEFMTVSNDGIIGLFMNVLSTVAFVTLATIIYKKRPNNKGLIVGLAAGTILMTLVMVGWNYIVTPVYLKIPQAEVVKMLLPIIVPFNIIKATINSGIIFLVHKPVLQVFERYNLIESNTKSQRASNYVIAVILIASALVLLNLVNNL
jgi:riboflavin transporter FmnP